MFHYLNLPHCFIISIWELIYPTMRFEYSIGLFHNKHTQKVVSKHKIDNGLFRKLMVHPLEDWQFLVENIGNSQDKFVSSKKWELPVEKASKIGNSQWHLLYFCSILSLKFGNSLVFSTRNTYFSWEFNCKF